MIESELRATELKEYNLKAVEACKVWCGDIGYAAMVAFAAYLKDPVPPTDENGESDHYLMACRGYLIVNIRNPDVRKQIDLILGPHGKTLLKVWKIQNET